MSAAQAKKPRSTQPLTPGRVVGERYVVQRVLGQGGMGQVVEVEHVGLGRRFALKVLRLERWNDELVRRFNREARALAKLTTPRVAQVTDFGVDEEGGPFYVMELLDGETLEQRIERLGCLAPREALTICAELAEALAEVHAAGIVHRDLKPSNVGLPSAGPVGVKLLDFGLAAAMDDAFLSRITQSQQILGSLPYMAPEQFNGAEPHPSMDVYAVGIVLFESLVGRLPFLAPSTAALIHQILSTPPPALPPELTTLGPIEPLLERLLAKEPHQRFASAAAAAQALRQAAEKLGGPVIGRAHPMTRVPSEPESKAARLPPTVQAGAPMPPTMEARAVESDRIGHMPTMMAPEVAPPAESGTRLSSHGHGHGPPVGAGPDLAGSGPTSGAGAHPSTQPPTQAWSAPAAEPSHPHALPHPASWSGHAHPSAPHHSTAASPPPGSPALRFAMIAGIGLLLFGLTGVAVAVGMSLLDGPEVASEDDTPPPPPVPTPIPPETEPPEATPPVESGEVESGEVAGADGVPSPTEAGADPTEAGEATGEDPEEEQPTEPAARRRSPERETPVRAPAPHSYGGASPTTPSYPSPQPRRGTGTWQGEEPSRQW